MCNNGASVHVSRGGYAACILEEQGSVGAAHRAKETCSRLLLEIQALCATSYMLCLWCAASIQTQGGRRFKECIVSNAAQWK